MSSLGKTEDDRSTMQRSNVRFYTRKRRGGTRRAPASDAQVDPPHLYPFAVAMAVVIYFVERWFP